MKTIVCLALAAGACLCLSACATGPAAQLNDAVQNVAPAIQIVVQQDAESGLIDQATADQVGGYVSAVQTAVGAYQAGSAACAALDRQACALAAFGQALAAGDQLLANPSIGRLIGASAGPRVQAALAAARKALLAAEDARAAASATDQQQKTAEVLAAVLQLNGALLQALQATR